MSKLEFTINQNDRQARTGLLQVNGRQVETPALVASGDELEKLSPLQLKQTGIRAVKTSGLKRWLKYEPQHDSVLRREVPDLLMVMLVFLRD